MTAILQNHARQGQGILVAGRVFQQAVKQLEERLASSVTGASFPETARRRLAVQNFLLQERNKDFREFVEKLYRDVALAVAALETVDLFEQLIQERGMRLEVLNDMAQLQAIFSAEHLPNDPHLTFGSFGLNGGFGVRSDGVLLITPDRLRHYQDSMRSLQTTKLAA